MAPQRRRLRRRRRQPRSHEQQSAPAATAAPPTAATSQDEHPQTAPLQSTPHTNKARGHHPYSSTLVENIESYLGLADEMQGRYKLCDIEEFLDLLPTTRKKMPEPAYDMLGALDLAPAEKDMYELFNAAVEQWVKPLGEFYDTSRRKIDTAVPAYGLVHISPDGTMYRDRNLPTETNVLIPKKAEMCYEAKKDEEDEPFGDDEKTLELPSKSARKTRGQIAAQINAIQAAQPRTAVFHIFFLRTSCRLLCHTRSGTLVTPRFNMSKEPHLHKFLWRLSHAKPEARGHDTTFRLVREIAVPRGKAKTELTKDVRAAKKKLNLTTDDPIYRVEVGHEYKAQNSPKYVYVSEPFTRTHNYIIGRGTRCFSAYDPVGDRVVTLKDTWRIPTYEAEHDIYASLHAARVPNIAGIVAAGEVPGQTISLGDKYVMNHYRIVLDRVGRPLESFAASYWLISCLRDAVISHQVAVDDAKILHRDISAGNVIIVEDATRPGEYRGMLIDWERGKRTDDNDGARATERTGTWQFMAIELLQQTPPIHAVSHDIESVIYVALWTAAKYAKNAMAEKKRNSFFSGFDYGSRDPAGEKLKMLQAQPLVVMALENDYLSLILQTLVNQIVTAYIDVEKLRFQWKGQDGKLSQEYYDTKARVATAQEQLSTHAWLLDTLTRALDNAEWKATIDPAVEPLRDTSSDDPLAALGKRKREEYVESVEVANSYRVSS